jgi:hypothetical protein
VGATHRGRRGRNPAGFLERQRATFAWKSGALDTAGLRAPQARWLITYCAALSHRACGTHDHAIERAHTHLADRWSATQSADIEARAHLDSALELTPQTDLPAATRCSWRASHCMAGVAAVRPSAPTSWLPQRWPRRATTVGAGRWRACAAPARIGRAVQPTDGNRRGKAALGEQLAPKIALSHLVRWGEIWTHP